VPTVIVFHDAFGERCGTLDQATKRGEKNEFYVYILFLVLPARADLCGHIRGYDIDSSEGLLHLAHGQQCRPLRADVSIAVGTVAVKELRAEMRGSCTTATRRKGQRLDSASGLVSLTPTHASYIC
jgi:hypothetical protein